MKLLREKTIYKIFEVSVILKGVHALLELVGGTLLYFISTNTIATLISRLTQEELTEDPNDSIAHTLINSARHLSVDAKSFAAFYLLSHGLIKIVLVGGLLRKQHWAYPASLLSMSVFILYQLYRFALTPSISLMALTIFDLIVTGLIWHEYTLVRQHKPLG